MPTKKSLYDGSARWFSKMKIKDDYIEIETPLGRTLRPKPPPIELYRRAFHCLLDNIRSVPLPPHKYKKLYEDLDIENLYIKATEVGGPPDVCRVCFEFLQGKQKAYCGKHCRNTYKVRQGRSRHPERKLKRS
jgi:hypothetical protein